MRDMSSPGQEVVFLFPGQGSQHYQMGRELFDADPAFRRLMTSLDAGYAAREGASLLAHLYGPKTQREPLDDICLSHPLLVMLEYSLALTLAQRGIVPGLLLGSSVGEFAAHAFAGRMPIERALEMVTWQARYALQHVEEGYMLAVMAPPEVYQRDPGLQALGGLAGAGMPGAMVLSGPRAHLAPLEAALRERGLAYHRLPVRVPFHHRLVEPMYQAWIGAFGADVARAPALPMLGQFADAPGCSYAQSLWDVIRQPFDFPALLARLDPAPQRLFIDVGPGTLANWIRHGGLSQPNWRTCGLLSPFGGDLARLHGLSARIAG